LYFGKTEIFLHKGLDRQLTRPPADLPVGQSADQQVTPEPAQCTALLPYGFPHGEMKSSNHSVLRI
jgi:hypothetical protein